MALTEALRFLITSDSAQARADMARLGQTTTQTMSGLDKLKSAFGAGLGIGAGAGALDAGLNALGAVGRFAVSQMQQAVGAASNLQQAQGAVKAIFRESSGEVERFGRTAAESVGLSNAAYQQQASVIGALLQNLGQTREQSAQTSQELIQIGADLAATFGGTTADAVAAIGSALRGERDPIERYGVSIKEAQVQNKALELGLAATAAELDDTAKATATLALIQDQAASSSGAFARESDTLAGQQQRFRAELEDARAELGEALLPAMTELVQVSRDLIPVLSFVAGQVETIADVAGKAAGPVQSLFGGLDSLVAPLRDMPVLKNILGQNDEGETARFAAAVRDLFVAVDKGEQSASALLPALAALPPTLRETVLEIAGIGPAADASAVGTDGLAKSLSGLQKQAAGVADGLFGADRAQASFFKSLASGGGGGSAKNAEKAMRAIEDATRNLADAQASLQETEIQRFLTSLGASSDEITLAQIAERDSTRGLAEAKRDLVDAQERLRQLREGDAASLLDAEAENIAAQRALVEAERSGDAVALKRAQADLIRSEEDLAKARDPASVEELADAERDVQAAQDAVLRAEIDAKRAREELNEVVNLGRDGSKDLAEANKAVEREQRRVEQAERALVDANDALNTSTSGLGGTVKSANDRFLEGVSAADGWLKKLIDGKATPEEFAGAVDTIRANLKGVADEAGKTQALDEYLGKIQAIYDKINELNGVSGTTAGKLSGLVGQSASIGANAAGTSTVNLNIDGKRFGQLVVDSLIQYANDNGAIPIRTR